MKKIKINKIEKSVVETADITVKNNHNFFANGFLIHNCSYRGNIGVIIYNTTDEIIEIKKGDKIAQAILHKIPKVNEIKMVEDLDETLRGSKGFGSSGYIGSVEHVGG